MLWPFGSIWRPMRRTSRGTVDLRWVTARSWTTKWYPQGIDLGERDGRRTLAVSWFRQDRARRHLASRVTFIDLERSRRFDVALAIEDPVGELVPAQIHAGGLAWFEDRLFVAATGQGIWEFDLADLRRVTGPDARRLRAARWPRSRALAVVRSRVHPVPLRCSFLGRVIDVEGESLPRVLIGEYLADDRGRIGEFSIPQDSDGRFEETARFVPGIRHMQGAVRWGEEYFVSQSDGLRDGALWHGRRDDLARSPIPLPVGCEDLALDLEENLLWSLGEHPWRRVVRGIPFSLLGIGTAGRT
ncbi:hypothetical protein [Microbacterium sp. SD291]|uniref:hypothetical protein n=1 Tax=Microbacterium sp. SD291 TaxID=2782007 RepID=UPI001A96D0F1|nr:hypothetical protein [Microbacterium sp. SD291]MBO0981624.1 hypothetical protein [Microbacterium sp. SD291]